MLFPLPHPQPQELLLLFPLPFPQPQELLLLFPLPFPQQHEWLWHPQPLPLPAPPVPVFGQLGSPPNGGKEGNCGIEGPVILPLPEEPHPQFIISTYPFV